MEINRDIIANDNSVRISQASLNTDVCLSRCAQDLHFLLCYHNPARVHVHRRQIIQTLSASYFTDYHAPGHALVVQFFMWLGAHQTCSRTSQSLS